MKTMNLYIQEAFYASTSYPSPKFSSFREEETFDLNKLLLPEDDDLETEELEINSSKFAKMGLEEITIKFQNDSIR